MSAPTEYLQPQFTLERINEQYYKALEAAARDVNRPGAAKFFHESSQDERQHAKRVKRYMIARGLQPAFESIPTIPAVDGKDYPGMFKMALKRETMTTQSLQDNTAAALKANDWQSVSFYVNSDGKWPGFHAEQTEEEQTLNDFIKELDRCGKDESAIELFDAQLLKKYR